jgi:hypothetical protein
MQVHSGYPLVAGRGYTCHVGKDSVAIGALLGAIAGAALGRYVHKRRASEPAEDDFGERLANLENEIEELEGAQRRHKESVPLSQRASGPSLERPRLIPEVRGKSPEQQYLVLTADRNFRLSRIDYVSNQGKTVISENVDKAGRRVEVPINERKVSRVWYQFPRQDEAPTPFKFRCHLNLDGVATESVVPAVIRQKYMWIGPARTLSRNVTLAT